MPVAAEQRDHLRVARIGGALRDRARRSVGRRRAARRRRAEDAEDAEDTRRPEAHVDRPRAPVAKHNITKHVITNHTRDGRGPAPPGAQPQPGRAAPIAPPPSVEGGAPPRSAEAAPRSGGAGQARAMAGGVPALPPPQLRACP